MPKKNSPSAANSKKHRRRVSPSRRAAAPGQTRKGRGAERLKANRASQSLKRNRPADAELLPARSAPKVKVGFVFSNDPDPMLVERMLALEETGAFETHAIYWHRSGSDLSFPFTPAPLSSERFTQINLADPRAGALSRCWLTFLFAWSIMRWVRQHNFPILHVVYPNMLIATFMATLGRRLQIVYDVWDVNHAQSMSALQRFVFRRLLSKTRQVFTTSQAFIDDFILPNQILQKGARATHVSNAPYHHASNTSRKTTSGNRASTHRTSTPSGIDQQRPLVIGCVGNLRVPRQMQMLIDSVETLRESGRNVRIRLSGAGSRKQMAVDAAGKYEFIEYTGPYDYRRDAAQLYAALDVVFAVYPLEVFNYRVHIARRLHDAVLSGTPIVVARDTHMAKIVDVEGTGWSVDHNVGAELIALLENVYDDRRLLHERVRNAEVAASKHGFEAYRDEYLHAYRLLVEPAHAKTSQHAERPSALPMATSARPLVTSG